MRCKWASTLYRLLPNPRVCGFTSNNIKASGLTRTHTQTPHCDTRPTRKHEYTCVQQSILAQCARECNCNGTLMITCFGTPNNSEPGPDRLPPTINVLACPAMHKTHITKTPGKPCACRPGTGRKGPWWPSTGRSTTRHTRTARWGPSRFWTTANARHPAKPTIERASAANLCFAVSAISASKPGSTYEQNLTYNR